MKSAEKEEEDNRVGSDKSGTIHTPEEAVGKEKTEHLSRVCGTGVPG
jgi:hypothetical protein